MKISQRVLHLGVLVSLISLAAYAAAEPWRDGANAGRAGSKPNIVFVFVDDWGYADVGFRNPAIKSPMLDELAQTGVILDRHYVFKYCSPSRASLMSGRWPHHAHQWNIVPQTVPLGLNLNFTAMPAKLKQAGYSTHMIGKWHLGVKSEEYLPVNRGFDSMTGFLTGGEDHITPQLPDCNPNCLYDIRQDPRETTDLYHSQPDVAKQLMDRYLAYAKEPREMQDQGYHARSGLPDDAKVACPYFAAHGNYWQPWIKS